MKLRINQLVKELKSGESIVIVLHCDGSGRVVHKPSSYTHTEVFGVDRCNGRTELPWHSFDNFGARDINLENALLAVFPPKQRIFTEDGI